MDYDETLLQVIDEVVKARITEAQLDKTVMATILETDWTNTDEGEYFVEEDNAKYLAYGAVNAYQTGDKVWVLIPKGDYNKQKIILSKNIAINAEETIPSTSYQEQIPDIVDPSYKNEYSLLTNGNTYSILLFEYTLNRSDISMGCNGINVTAKFKTDIANLQILRGNYGLCIVCTIDDDGDDLEETFYLDCRHMWGNPYEMPVFFEQNSPFSIDLASAGYLKHIKVFFFQTYCPQDDTISSIAKVKNSNKFVDVNGNNVDPNGLSNNLFVKDLEISLGYIT